MTFFYANYKHVYSHKKIKINTSLFSFIIYKYIIYSLCFIVSKEVKKMISPHVQVRRLFAAPDNNNEVLASTNNGLLLPFVYQSKNKT